MSQPHPRNDGLREELDRRYRAPLMKYFLRRVRSRAEAEDLTQEVFLRVIDRADATDIDNSGGFVFRAAMNLLRDKARREKIRTGYAAETQYLEPAPEEPSPERVILARESLRAVLSALEGVGEKTRDIFLLHRLENMKHQQIADLHGMTVSSVEKHMAKALAAVMKSMGRKQ